MEGPSSEGQEALDEALAVTDPTLSFDDESRLPEKQTIRTPAPTDTPLVPRRVPPKWQTWLGLSIVRSCLLMIVFFGLVVPVGLVIVGVALLGPALRYEAAYRSAPVCTSPSPTNAPCQKTEPATVLSARDQFGRAGSWTDTVTIALADGQQTLIIYAAYPLQPRPAFSSASVLVKVYAGRITELDTGGTTYQTADSPLTQSPVGPVVAMIVIGGLYLVILVGRRRARLFDDARGIWSMWSNG